MLTVYMGGAPGLFVWLFASRGQVWRLRPKLDQQHEDSMHKSSVHLSMQSVT